MCSMHISVVLVRFNVDYSKELLLIILMLQTRGWDNEKELSRKLFYHWKNIMFHRGLAVPFLW